MAALATAVLGGCGNWSDEDAEFQAAVPRREELSLTPPGATAEQALAAEAYAQRVDGLLQQSEVYAHVVKTARDVNRFVVLLTAGLDFVRTLEPSEREPGRRVWGPYADRERPGYQVRVEMVRAGDGFDFALQWRPGSTGEFQVPLTGHFAGERASRGEGRFHYEASRVRAFGWSTEGNATVDLAYDMSDGVARADLSWVAETGASFQVRYRVEPRGAGWMRYGLHANFPQTATSAMEDFEVLAGWGADKAGRADVTVTGGDIGGSVGRYGECWDSSFAQVWRQRNFECWPAAAPCSEGDATRCVRGEVTD